MENKNLSKTGDRCPRSGEWIALEDLTSSVFVTKGEEMPSYKGRCISWQFKASL